MTRVTWKLCGNKCRLSLRESTFFRGAKSDNLVSCFRAAAWFAVYLAGFSQISADSTTAKVPQYTIQQTSAKIVIDGQLNESDWKNARDVGKFQFPWWTVGKKEQTVAKMLWDDRNLYVAYRCEDAHIWAEHTKRDSPVYRDDCVELFTAPNPDRPDDYFNIEMNVNRAFLDRHHPNGPGIKPKDNWNAKDVRIAVSVNGTKNDDSDVDRDWILEAAIPFANFVKVAKNSPPKPGDVWHLNLNRLGGKTNPQYSQWSPSKTERPSFHVPKDFGRVVFSHQKVSSRD